MTRTLHYHVGANTPGYLSDNETYTISTKRDAIAALADDVRRYRDQEYDLPRRNRRTGHGSAKSGYVHFERPGDVYDLGLSFWWARCSEPDCNPDGEEN